MLATQHEQSADALHPLNMSDQKWTRNRRVVCTPTRVLEVATAFNAPLLDYERNGDWMLLCSGGGIMLGIMDCVPQFRWCMDADNFYGHPAQLADFMEWGHACAFSRVAVAGWFSISDPAPLRAVVSRLSHNALVYAAHAELGGFVASSLARFLEACERTARADALERCN